MTTECATTRRAGLALRVIDLGRLAYANAMARQRTINQRVIHGLDPPTLLLLEHDPVITISRRPSAAGHLLASASQLARLGIDIERTDRGGDITYHGPGQLVAYPVIHLGHLALSLGGYIHWLEQIVIETLAAFGVRGQRETGNTGVWVEMEEARCSSVKASWKKPTGFTEGSNPTLAKICALGLRVRKNVTMHGLALNVAPDLSHFDVIVPCGLSGRAVTSLQQLLGEAAPPMTDVKRRFVNSMRSALRTVARKQ